MRVGLALGGGVVRGLAHVGILEVLSREGIRIDYVAGTSAGALIGALFCAGLDVSALHRAASRIRWRDVAAISLSRQGFFTFARMERWFVDQVGDLTFADLRLPFVAVATDLDAGEPVVLREGRVAAAVRASSSVPGLVVPVRAGGHVLGDGGVSDNLPVIPVRELGADYVIGVNLFCPSFHRWNSPFSMGFRAVETLVRRAGGGLRLADCLISPDLEKYNYFRFSRQEELMLAGADAARRALPGIRAALAGALPPREHLRSEEIAGHGEVQPSA